MASPSLISIHPSLIARLPFRSRPTRGHPSADDRRLRHYALRHLVAIGEAELLPRLYGIVIVPGAVWAELQAEATPLMVKTWLADPPNWLEVRSSPVSLP
jgi:hypothetical protein